MRIHTTGDTVLVEQGTSAMISTDNGDAWNPLPPPPIPADNPLYVYQIGPEGILCGDNFAGHDRPATGLFLTQDLGKSWKGPFHVDTALQTAVLWKGMVVASKTWPGVVRLDPRSGFRTSMSDGLPDTGAILLRSAGSLLLAYCTSQGRVFRYSEPEGRWKTILEGIPVDKLSLLRIEGGRILVAYALPGLLRLRESWDGGNTWTELGAEVPGEVFDLLPTGSSYLAANNVLGAVRLDSGFKVAGLENAGFPRETLWRVHLSGNRLIGEAAGEWAIHRSDDRGLTWTRQTVERNGQQRPFQVLQMGQSAYMESPDSMISLSPPGIGLGSFPKPFNVSPDKLVDGVGKVYLVDNLYSRGSTLSYLHVAAKGTWAWSASPVLLPIPQVSDLAADGESLLLIHGNSSAHRSLDAGATWSSMSTAPWKTGTGIHVTARHTWMVASDQGLFRADLDQRSWTPLAFTGSEIRILAALGNHVAVLRDSASVHFSHDEGATWSSLSLPFPVSELRGMALSDSLACLSRGAPHSARRFYCADLENLPLGLAKPRWKERTLPRAGWFTGGGMEFPSLRPGLPSFNALGQTRAARPTRPTPR